MNVNKSLVAITVIALLGIIAGLYFLSAQQKSATNTTNNIKLNNTDFGLIDESSTVKIGEVSDLENASNNATSEGQNNITDLQLIEDSSSIDIGEMI